MLALHSYSMVSIEQVKETITLSNGKVIPKGYVNLTQMLKAGSKETGKTKNISNYFNKGDRYEFLVALSEDSNQPICTKGQAITSTGIIDKITQEYPKTQLFTTEYTSENPPLVISNVGGFSELPGTFAHPKVGIHFAQWCSPRFAVWASKTLLLVLQGDYLALTPEAEEAEQKLNRIWDRLRTEGKVTRRTLTDAIKDYLVRHKEELSADYLTWIYSNATNKMYRAVFGMTAKKLEEFLGCGRHESRDYLNSKCLKQIDWMEATCCKLIDKKDKEPCEAVAIVIDMFDVEVIQPVHK